VALAGRVIASHYSEPLERRIAAPVDLRSEPSVEAQAAAHLSAGDRFLLLDDSLGWAWGYGGAEGRVGYIPSDALA
jgi:hypothetical protein